MRGFLVSLNVDAVRDMYRSYKKQIQLWPLLRDARECYMGRSGYAASVHSQIAAFYLSVDARFDITVLAASPVSPSGALAPQALIIGTRSFASGVRIPIYICSESPVRGRK